MDKDAYRKQIRDLGERCDELQLQLFQKEGQLLSTEAKLKRLCPDPSTLVGLEIKMGYNIPGQRVRLVLLRARFGLRWECLVPRDYDWARLSLDKPTTSSDPPSLTSFLQLTSFHSRLQTLKKPHPEALRK